MIERTTRKPWDLKLSARSDLQQPEGGGEVKMMFYVRNESKIKSFNLSSKIGSECVAAEMGRVHFKLQKNRQLTSLAAEKRTGCILGRRKTSRVQHPSKNAQGKHYINQMASKLLPISYHLHTCQYYNFLSSVNLFPPYLNAININLQA